MGGRWGGVGLGKTPRGWVVGGGGGGGK